GCGHDALQIRDLNRPPASRRGLFETRPTKAERRLCEGPGSAEHHDAPIPSERVCKSACGASCCTASGTHTPSSLTSGDARSSYGRVPLELNGRVGTGALCAPCPPLATDRVGTGRGVKLASRNDS